MSNNPKEIERKFLVKNDDWKKNVVSFHDIEQYYLSSDPDLTVRIRKVTVSPNNCYHILTFKSKTNDPMIRYETEMGITSDKYEELTHFSKYNPIIKTRCRVAHTNDPDSCPWEVDVFHGQYDGLVLAEIELTDTKEHIEIPNWCGEEVTGNPLYTNNFMVTQK